MPYILQVKRKFIDKLVRKLYCEIQTSGDLNYTITKLIDYYIGQKPSYDKLNEVLGVLSAVDFELKRRVVAPYEDRKCNKNGDVYTPRGY